MVLVHQVRGGRGRGDRPGRQERGGGRLVSLLTSVITVLLSCSPPLLMPPPTVPRTTRSPLRQCPLTWPHAASPLNLIRPACTNCLIGAKPLSFNQHLHCPYISSLRPCPRPLQAGCSNCLIWAKSDNVVRRIKTLSPGQRTGYIVMNETEAVRREGMHVPLRLTEPEVVGMHFGE